MNSLKTYLVNKIIFLFIIFSMIFFSFLVNTNLASADTIDCAGREQCVQDGGGAYCDDTNIAYFSCNCGSTTATCDDNGTFSCTNNGDGMTYDYCRKNEICDCAPPQVVYGCTDPGASNYNSNATLDDGSCTYPPPPVNCGNGVVNAGESCDLGVNNGSCPGGCSLSCTNIFCAPPGSSCGDGYVDPGEQCDTGVNNGGCPRTCSNSCTVNSCGGTTRTITFTSTGPGRAEGYTSTGASGPWTYLGTCRETTCVVPLPVNTYVSINAIHDTLGGSFNWLPVCPAAGSGATCYGQLLNDVSGGVNFVGVTTPVMNNISINTGDVNPDGSTQYTITSTASDSGGGSKINQQYALINHQGTNAGQYRGYLTWATFSWDGHKDNMACSGGGYAAIQSTNGNTTFGHDYIELDSCSTTVSGGSRVTNFVVRFNPLFRTNGPWMDNDISGYVYNINGNGNGWTNYDINFGLITTPVMSNVTISSPSVLANGSTQYAITVTGTDSRGGSNITREHALVNLQGTNAGQHRGFLAWATTGNILWPSEKDLTACSTGGGYAVIMQTGANSIYGYQYMELDSCSTSVSGNTRTVTFNIRFNPSFTTPTTLNDISGYVTNSFLNSHGWINPDQNFSLNLNAVPTVTTPTATSITSTGATLGANVTSLGVPASISARGTCWGTSPNPTTNCVAEGGGTTGVYSHSRTGFSPNTTYYYRGYATNTTGTGYSTDGTFTTPTSPTLSASPSSVSPGASVTVTFANVPTPTPRDWIGQYILGQSGNSFLNWKYTSNNPCTQSAGSARASGSCTFTMPVNPGDYNFRLYANDSASVQYAVSNTVTVTSPTTYTLNVAANPGPGGRITGPGINCGADCSENVSAGTNVTLTAVPASSYWRFTGWGGACSGTSPTCNITVNANTNVTATFVPRAFIYREF